MREVTVRVRFTSPSLGNQKREDGQFVFQRGPDGRVLFLATWHRGYLQRAAELAGRYQNLVHAIQWDIHLDGRLRRDPWFREFYVRSNRRRFRLHEAFFPGQIVGVNCVLPRELPLDGFASLMTLAGRYWGASPWQPGKWGFFEVLGVEQRRRMPDFDEDGGDPLYSLWDAMHEQRGETMKSDERK